MQVFQRSDAMVACGIDEALAVLALGAGSFRDPAAADQAFAAYLAARDAARQARSRGGDAWVAGVRAQVEAEAAFDRHWLPADPGRAPGVGAARRRPGRRLGAGHRAHRPLPAGRPPGERLPGGAGPPDPGRQQRAPGGGRGRGQAGAVLRRPLRPLGDPGRRRLRRLRRRRPGGGHRRPGGLVGRARPRHHPPRPDRHLRRRHRGRGGRLRPPVPRGAPDRPGRLRQRLGGDLAGLRQGVRGAAVGGAAGHLRHHGRPGALVGDGATSPPPGSTGAWSRRSARPWTTRGSATSG